jgi:phosphomannomutase
LLQDVPASDPPLSCFKTYDVRGRLGHDLDEAIATRIGHATALALKARCLAVGGDARLSTPALKAALVRGIAAAGCDVIDLGLTGTEEIYFASMHLDIDGGIEVTASHNPADYNGFKFVARKGAPLSDAQYAELRGLASASAAAPAALPGQCRSVSLLAPYVDHLLAQVDLAALAPLHIVADVGNGAAGHVVAEIRRRFEAAQVPVAITPVNAEPDGRFPNGVPNPLLPERRAHTIEAVRRHGAGMGIAWDGDFDRCFFYDGEARYVSGYYVTGLLMAHYLERAPRSRFVLDCRLNWNSYDILAKAGGTGVPARTGHRFFKDVMRREGAIYGGEVSAHHYFRSFAYCDSGMLPWLLVLEHLGRTGKTLAAAVAERQALFPSSEEINFQVPEPAAIIERVAEEFARRGAALDRMDGLTIDAGTTRINLRASNTEHLLRLNVEARQNAAAVERGVHEISQLVRRFSG